MHTAVSYTSYSKYLRVKVGDIIMFEQFEYGNLLSETRDDIGIGNKYYDDSTMPPLIRKEEMYAMDSGNESDDEPMSTKVLEDICDGSQSHPSVNRRQACYKIRDCIK